MWVGMFREDRLQPTFKRIRRTVTLGPCSNMSRRAALAEEVVALGLVRAEVE